MTAQAFGNIADKFVRNNKPGRRTEQPVRRNSYDVDDRRAKVFRPIGDGSVKGAMRWREKFLQAAKEYDREIKEKGKRHPIGANAIRVLEILLWNCGVDFKTGRLDPAIATIQEKSGFARKTVVDALARLKEHGFLNWVRRTERTGNARDEGPQVKQATNAYYFDMARMRERAMAAFRRLQQLLGRPFTDAALNAPKDENAPLPPLKGQPDPILEATIARIEASHFVESASSQSSQNPPSRN